MKVLALGLLGSLLSAFFPQIIYMARNVKDNAVSYFHFHRMDQGMPEPGNWDQFLAKFMAGKGE